MTRTLLVFFLSIPVLLFAQKRKTEPVAVDRAEMNVLEPHGSKILGKRANTIANQGTSQNPQKVSSTLTKLGESANPFTSAFGFRSALQYDPDLNMVSFPFRQNPTFYGSTGSSGLIRYSYSSDGGANWTNNNGVLWDNTVGNNGRYPQGFIWNPSGNTDPAQAYQVFVGPTLEGTNGGWGGVAYGSLQISNAGGTSTDQGVFVDSSNSTKIYIPEGGTVANGKFWVVEASADAVPSPIVYNDSLALYEGDIQGGALNITRRSIYFPTQNDTDPPASMQIAFAPDGQTGFIVGLGRLDSAAYPKRAVNLLYMKTTDGGATWGTPQEFYFADDPVVISSIGDSVSATNIASAQFEVDVVVDTFGNPHTLMNIEWRPDNDYGFTYVGQPSTMWHVYSTDGGTNWTMNRVATTHLRYGGLGTDPDDMYMESRPQMSRDVTGRYIMMGWFDTDTTIFTPPSLPPCTGFSSGFCGNCQRTLYYRGYNAVKDFYSDSTQLLSSSFGLMTFEYIADMSIRTNTGIEIPIQYQQPEWYLRPPGGATWPIVEHFYESGVIVTYEELGDTLATGIKEVKNLEKLAVFPNPVDDQLNIDLQSRIEGPITVEVLSLLGIRAMETQYHDIGVGANFFKVDMSSLDKGVYLLRIGVGGEYTTRKIVVE